MNISIISTPKMTETKERQIMGKVAPVASLSHDIWYLILENVPRQRDLASLCRVCKALYSLATQVLYRKIPIGPPPPVYIHSSRWNPNAKPADSRTQWATSLALVRRLAAFPGNNQSRAVREVEIQYFAAGRTGHLPVTGDFRQQFEEELPKFIKAAPNLQHVRVCSPRPAFTEFFRALHEHPNKPEIHLLREDGTRHVSGPLPGVVTLNVATQSPWRDTPDKANRVIPATQKLFFACPDLKAFTLTVYNAFGGCVIEPVYHSVIQNFQFPLGDDNNNNDNDNDEGGGDGDGGSVVFPPLEFLSLSGYNMDVDKEWPRWRDGLDWSRLHTLILGPDPRYSGGATMADLLTQFRGHATTLRSLTVQTWADEGEETCPPLEGFLSSFSTLQELVVKRHFVPAQTLVRHTRLKRLVLHCIEVFREQPSVRPTLSVEDLAVLDKNCPELEILEIDISRSTSVSASASVSTRERDGEKEREREGKGEKGTWPKDVLTALALSFPRLRELTLHCEIGLDFQAGFHPKGPSLPALDESLVRDFAEQFFALRSSSSRLEKISIKTGEMLRRFPQWSPGYASTERRGTRKFDAWKCWNTGEVKVKLVRKRDANTDDDVESISSSDSL